MYEHYHVVCTNCTRNILLHCVCHYTTVHCKTTQLRGSTRRGIPNAVQPIFYSILMCIGHSHLLEECAKASRRVFFGSIRVNTTASCQPSFKHSTIGKVQRRLEAIDVHTFDWFHLYKLLQENGMALLNAQHVRLPPEIPIFPVPIPLLSLVTWQQVYSTHRGEHKTL